MMEDETMKFLKKNFCEYETKQAYIAAYRKIEGIFAEFPRLRMIYMVGNDEEKRLMAWDLLFHEIEEKAEVTE